MRAYIIRRVLLIIPTLILVSMIVFLLARFIPGEAVEMMAAQIGTEEGVDIDELVARIRRDLGMDKPIIIQYLRWLGILPQHEWGGSAESSVGEVTTIQITSEKIIVRANVSNPGDDAGDYKATLLLNGAALETKEIVVHAEEILEVSFLTTTEPDANYTIEVAGYSDFSGVLQGSLGKSLLSHRSISEDILDKIPISLELGFIAITVGLLLAFPIGIYSAIRQDSIGDYIGRSISILFMAIPGFWIATIIWVYGTKWGIYTPPPVYIKINENFAGNIKQFIIPGILMGMASSGVTMRMTRTMMLEVLRQDYIRTAWSKGLRERVVVIRHALKNALIPVITIIGLGLPVLIGGTVIIEQIFQLPGMGRYMIESLGRRDYTIISGVNLMMATVILFCNLAVDLTYGWLDPRIRYR